MKQILLSFVLCCLVCCAIQAQAGDITVSDPWIAEAPPVARVMAAYMTISNNSSKPVQLLSAASSDFNKIELHQTTMHGGMAHMMAHATLPIGEGSRAVLQPGGYHLMLIHPVRPLKAGDHVDLELRFDSGETLTVTTPVRKKAME